MNELIALILYLAEHIPGGRLPIPLPLEELRGLVRAEAVERYEEGFDIDIPSVTLEIERAASQAELIDIYRELGQAPLRAGYPYYEPSGLEGILRERPGGFRELETPKNLEDKVMGGWLGRICGCMLGKPVEGWTRDKIRERLVKAEEYPLEKPYFPAEAFTEEELTCVSRLVRGRIIRAERDDDLDYTVLNLLLYEEKGDGFTALDVGEKWLTLLPYKLTYTAERAAYRNLVLGLKPPETATWLNPYREWIGAQIRADLWGYVSPGNPEKASLLAYRDASLSHTKNGIYGEMFFAAAISAAYSLEDPLEVVEEALKAIPRRSRLFEAVRRVVSLYKSGVEWEEAVTKILEEYPYHPVHTINNAALVVAALLWGEKDYAKTVTYAVLAGLDTDCNGATAGSVVGVMVGASGIPKEWWEPLNDTLHTALSGVGVVRISEIASRTLRLAAQHAHNLWG